MWSWARFYAHITTYLELNPSTWTAHLGIDLYIEPALNIIALAEELTGQREARPPSWGIGIPTRFTNLVKGDSRFEPPTFLPKNYWKCITYRRTVEVELGRKAPFIDSLLDALPSPIRPASLFEDSNNIWQSKPCIQVSVIASIYEQRWEWKVSTKRISKTWPFWVNRTI